MSDPVKISLITVCMGRKLHIQQTLKQNIIDNSDYPNLEFILLDYNSNDRLGEWVKNNMKEELRSGILKYYRTDDPVYFHRSHSRNMAFRLATGDILCNIDADNFAGKGFASYVNERFRNNKDAFLVYNHIDLRKTQSDLVGRFCCRKEDFLFIQGYDEVFANYGFEDKDIYERLKNAGKKEMYIEHDKFLQSIQHDSFLRHNNESFSKRFNSYYLNYISPESSRVLCLMNDNTFQRGTIVRTDLNYTLRILERKWESGTWASKGKRIYLNTENQGQQELLMVNKNILIDLNSSPYQTFIEYTDNATMHQLITRHSSLGNQEHYIFNKENKVTKVNNNTYGSGMVSFNFQSEKLILN